MEEKLLKFTEELAKLFKAQVATSDFQTQVKALKDSKEDSGTFRMVISTDHVDRHGEIVVQEGLQFENYMNNPIVLWGHDSYSIPVGITDKLITENDGVNKKTIAEGRFAPTEFAQTLRKIYDAGMLNTSSIGFIPLEYEGNKIIKAELLEWSFVSIPANPNANAIRSLGLDITALVQKGILKEVAAEGDDVTTPTDDELVDDVVEDIEATEEADSILLNEEEKKMIVVAGNQKFLFKVNDSFLNGMKEFFVDAKAGRVLSKANKEKIVNAKLALEEVIALSESAETEEGKAADVPADEKAIEVQEAEDFLKLRKGLQGVASMVQDILTEAKSDVANRGIRVK